MDGSVFRGVGTALVTPFDHGTVDIASLKKIVAFNKLSGIDYLVPLGTTGETSTLTEQECRIVMDAVLDENADLLPVVCGMFGKNNTSQVLDLINNTNLDGISAILVASPYYNKPSQAGLLAHFTAIADHSPVPVILYNVPSRTSVNISAETTLALADHPNVIATKEASGDFGQIMQILKYKPTSFEMLSGEDPITMPMIACGAAGVISVISNAFPGIFSDMVHHALHGHYDAAKKSNDLLLDVHKWLYIEGNPVGIKACLEMRGMCTSEVRLPLVAMSAENKGNLKKAIEALISP